MKDKILIYQVLPRLFGNINTTNKKNGTIEENGVGKFSAFSSKALDEIKNMGFSHIWYTGIIEHATKTDYTKYGIAKDHPDVVKGNAGSPYAIKDYYDVCPDLADNIDKRIEEFDALVARTHDSGMKVIIDFVPNHVARQYRSDMLPKGKLNFGERDDKNRMFVSSNNYYYIPNTRLEASFLDTYKDGGYDEYPAKVTGNNVFSNQPSVNDWYETVKLNYGIDYQNNSTHFEPVPDTWNKMKEILFYWMERGVDGFRCDMVEMVPVEFWGWVIPQAKSKNNNVVFIGEVYNPDEYRSYVFNGKFDYLYDKVGLYDTIRNVIVGAQPSSDITFCWQKTEDIQSNMLNFLENHDEQRIASNFFAGNAKKGFPGAALSALMNTNPFMLYFGQELGEKGMDEEGFSGLDGRTTIFDYWSVNSMVKWHNNGIFGTKNLSADQKSLRKQYIDILQIARNEKCFVEGAFYDLMYVNYENQQFDSTKQFVFLRHLKNEFVLVVVNFSDQKENVSVSIPADVYEYIGVNPEGIKKRVDLMKNAAFTLKVTEWEHIHLSIDANDVIILKFAIK